MFYLRIIRVKAKLEQNLDELEDSVEREKKVLTHTENNNADDNDDRCEAKRRSCGRRQRSIYG